MQTSNRSQYTVHTSLFDDMFGRSHGGDGAFSEEAPTRGDAVDGRERPVEHLLSDLELLRLLREPVEWMLALAGRLAAEDAVDLAAIARLRAAFLARLSGQPMRLRKTDVLIAAGLVLSALDPGIVLRALSGHLHLEPSISAERGPGAPAPQKDTPHRLWELLAALPPEPFRCGAGVRCPTHSIAGR